MFESVAQPRRQYPSLVVTCPLQLLIYMFLSLSFVTTALSSQAVAKTEDYSYQGTLSFDIRQVPFSRFGSYLSISNLQQYQNQLRKNGIYLRTMHGGGQDVLRFEMLHDGQSVPFSTTATPTLLTFSSSFGTVEIVFDGPDRLRVRGKGVGLKCIAEDGWTVPYPNNGLELNTDVVKYLFLPIRGEVHLGAAANSSGAQEPAVLYSATGQDGFEFEIDGYTTGWIRHAIAKTFSVVWQDAITDYAAWLREMPTVPARLGRGAELAAYVNWESVVEPSGNLKRPTMLMSKNWMASVWSWDHTFNAMALAEGNPKLAWDQFMLPFDIQNDSGDLADKWDAESISWEWSKPPVHGWVLARLMKDGVVRNKQQLQEIYGPLVKWTEWYFTYRDTNGNGIPEYRHGNESGWDNSTVFLDGEPLESPDLCAELVLQMETLADLATRLGKPAEAKAWREHSDRLLNNTINHFWRGNRFVAYGAFGGKEIDSKSLLLLMPIMLGHRLPPSVRSIMVADVKRRLSQSPHGIPTEPIDSSLYTPDGYWRGPIWAPSTMLIVDGLDDMGEHALAREIEERFCEMAQANGMAENYDAVTGQSLRDPAYTWSSSVFLIFAHNLR